MTESSFAPLPTRSCPGCSGAMRRQSYARRPDGTVDLDLCFDCRAIWFDMYESSALAPAAIIELFKAIAAQEDRPARPIASVTHCVTCRVPLQLTHDIQRTNRIVYYRCPAGHGRFTTFLQFLREKEFVRSLTPAEVQRLRMTVKQVRCSSCGAPVDIATDAQCPYCHSPVAILDPDAVRRELQELDDAERRRHTVDPHAAIDALLEGQRMQWRLDRIDPGPAPGPGPVDLVTEALGLLLRVA